MHRNGVIRHAAKPNLVKNMDKPRWYKRFVLQFLESILQQEESLQPKVSTEHSHLSTSFCCGQVLHIHNH